MQKNLSLAETASGISASSVGRKDHATLLHGDVVLVVLEKRSQKASRRDKHSVICSYRQANVGNLNTLVGPLVEELDLRSNNNLPIRIWSA
jgi:hypothetical protein